MSVGLRPVHREDWQFILDIRNQDEVRLACHDTSVIDVGQHKQYMENLEKDPHAYQWIITYDNNDVGHVKIIGQELGCMIKDGFRGKGIASSSYKLVFEEARKLGLHKINGTYKN